MNFHTIGAKRQFDLVAGAEIGGDGSRNEHGPALQENALSGTVVRLPDLGDAAMMNSFD